MLRYIDIIDSGQCNDRYRNESKWLVGRCLVGEVLRYIYWAVLVLHGNVWLWGNHTALFSTHLRFAEAWIKNIDNGNPSIHAIFCYVLMTTLPQICEKVMQIPLVRFIPSQGGHMHDEWIVATMINVITISCKTYMSFIASQEHRSWLMAKIHSFDTYIHVIRAK